METSGHGSSEEARTSLLAVLADEQRRRLLSILLDRGEPIPDERLARLLTAAERECVPDDVPRSAITPRRVAIEHVHAPTLAGAHLIERDRQSGTVTTTDHPAFEDPRFASIVAEGAPGWNEVLSCLADTRRRTVLATLLRGRGPMATSDVVETVATHEAASGVTGGSTDSLWASLRHVHLPKLDSAGLVEYDAASGTVAYEGHPGLDPEWVDVAPEDTPRPLLPTASRADGVWRLEGRSQIRARARTLYDIADEELFVMVTASGLLDRACIDRLADAVGRGVDVYVGSQIAAVRDRLSRAVPGATLWTLERDWLDPVGDRETVGRLVLADRSTALVGTHGLTVDDDPNDVTAVTASGTDNALVLLLRELLGSQIERIEARNEDSPTGIPL